MEVSARQTLLWENQSASSPSVPVDRQILDPDKGTTLVPLHLFSKLKHFGLSLTKDQLCTKVTGAPRLR